jgi:hypothetical protein
MVPSMSLTGDIWYDASNRLDTKFRDTFEKMILHFCAKECLNAEALHKRIFEAKIFSAIDFTVDHVKTLIRLLEHEERIFEV